MGVASSSLANPTRTKALMVRMAPYLVEAICELTRALKEKTHAQTEISGLLFGKSQDGLVTVEALKTFKDSSGPRSDLARRERMEKAFTAAMTLANEDPEFAAYKLLGWFSLRGGGGLINSDVEFHNHHFKNQEEIALIVWREGDTQLTTELYAPVDGGKLTTEDYRWSSVRLSTELRHVSSPVDLVMRVRMNDDLYMRTYGVSDGREKKEEWKRMADNAKRTLLSFLPGRGHSEVVFPEEAPIPPSSGTAKRSFESRTLFRGMDAEPSSPIPPELPKPQPAKAESTTAAPGVITRVQQPPVPAAPTPATETPSTGFDFNRAPRHKPAVAEVSGLPMVIPKNRPAPARGWPWLSTAMVFVVFSGITFGFMAIKAAGGGEGKLSQVMRVLFPGKDLELRADSHGDSLWVSWNRHNPVVASSSGAILSVIDGPRHFERRLDAGQVADGEVRYTPVSGDVTFQLKVFGTDQTLAAATLRVLDATAPVTAENKPPLDLSATPQPTEPAPPPPTANETPSTPTPLPGVTNNKVTKQQPTRTTELAANPSENKPALIPPSIPASDQAPVTKAPAEQTKPVSLNTPAIQQSPSQTAAQTTQPQREPVEPPPPPKPVSLPRPPVNGLTTPMQSHTAINGWDPSTLQESKPAPVQQQQQQSAQPDSKAVEFVPPKVLLQVMPNTRSLTPGSITEVTRVDVEVRVDEQGHVKAAHLDNPSVKQQLGNAALAAAKQWTFQPATLLGKAVESDHTIRFEFRPEAQ
jgi:TonB family protein